MNSRGRWATISLFSFLSHVAAGQGREEETMIAETLANIGFQKTGTENRFCLALGKNVDSPEFDRHANEIVR